MSHSDEKTNQSNADKQKSKVNNPHDKFFKQTFSEVEVARDYIETFFPEDVKFLLDLASTKQQNTSYVTEQLEDYFSDLVYEINLKDESESVLVTLLFEHKSYPVPDIKIQLLRYQLEIWTKQLENKINLTPVIPIVFYHGKTTWKTRSLTEYFPIQKKALERFIPDFDYLLTDLSNATDTELLQIERHFLRNILLVMKHRAETDYFLENPSLIFEYLEGDTSSQGSKIVQIYVYLLQSTDFTTQQIEAFHNKLNSTVKNITMSGYDVLIRKGKAEGKIEGKAEGILLGEEQKKIQTIKIGYEEGISVSLLAKINECTEEEVIVILKNLGLIIE